ncbi:MAG: T9SS type A sorting domain-containing protein [Bacteroidales bacterium]|nr:T9SS type A sorting domain-containing protein [Bacteroidales bacterium]
MKRILLIVLALGFGYATIAQQAFQFKIDTKAQKRVEAPAIGIDPVQSTAITKSKTENYVLAPSADRDVNIVTIIDIGTSANAYGYGYAGGQKSLVWADPGMNTVTNFHRMGGALDVGGYSGDLGYDVSTDGGTTWSTMNEIYVATDNGGGEYYYDAARYPNHGVYNPAGSSNPDDAYVVYFAPNLDGSNSDGSTGWGGYSYGVGNIGDTSVRTKNLKATHGDYYQYIPDAFDITSTGEAWVVDANQDWTSGSIVYLDQMILNRGTWNGSDFEYEESLMDAVMTPDAGRPAIIKVAFSPDGMTGYIVAIGNNGDAEDISGFQGYYPIYWKTTDGGDNWDGPNFIQLDGSNGIGGIVYNHLTDEQIAELFEPPVPAREEISYTTAFDCDIAVASNGNLHIAVVIAPTGSDPFSIITAEGYLAAVDIILHNDGSAEVEEMGRPRTFRGTFGDLTEDNRIQITMNEATDKVFISWLDTDLEDETDNNRPNIWVRGFDPNTYLKTIGSPVEDGPTNVTLFSEGMWQAYFFIAAAKCFENNGVYTIPFTYEGMDPNDPAGPVQFKYITDFTFDEAADFTIQDVEDNVASSITEVSQNFPNPFKGESFVTVTLNEGSNLNMDVYTLTGQRVSSKNYGFMTSGAHTLTIDGNNLSSGVYFYTITAGENKVTRKMIVE